MVNYLNAELYKVSKRKYPYIFTLVMLGFVALIMIMGLETKRQYGEGISFSSMTAILVMAMSAALYLVIMPCDMAFSEQYKHNTLKNEVAYGVPRARIYLGKLITALVTAVVLCAVIIAIYVLLSLVLFSRSDVARGMTQLLEALAVGVPTWMGGISLFFMLSFLFKGATAATIVYVCVVGVLPSALNMIGMIQPKLLSATNAIHACLLASPYDGLMQESFNIPYGWAVGMGWLVVTTVIGLLVFRKREIS